MISAQFFTMFTFLIFSCGSSSTNQNEKIEFVQLPTLENQVEVKQDYVPSKPTKSRWFSIAAVGEVRGEIEPCGCPTLPYGGFARRDMMLQEMQPSFHVDVGEMLLKGFSTKSHINSQERAKEIASLSKKVGVDVWSVGPSDVVALGVEILQKIEGPPMISATYTDKNGEYLFKPFVVLNTKDIQESQGEQNISVAFVGFSEKIEDPIVQKQLNYIEPERAWKKIIPKIPTNVDFIVGLSSISDQKLQKLEAKISLSSLPIPMFISTRGEAYEKVKYPSKGEYPNKATIVEVPDRGRYVEKLIIHLGSERSVPPILLGSEQKWRSFSENLMIAKQEEFEEFENVGKGFNLLFTESVALNQAFEPRKKTKIVNQLATFRDAQIQKAEEISKRSLEEYEVGYAAMGKCVRCHSQEMSKWSLTKHARAWETLILRGEENNPECIACHSTGYGQPGGFGELHETQIRKYKSVQCESCHGPMLSHPQNESVKPVEINEDVCTSCHDEANSPKFEYTSYLRRATCQ